jgi:hypothetical protein
MRDSNSSTRHQYRVWLCAFTDWEPRDSDDLPPSATAVEPAENGTMSALQAARYVQAFNARMMAVGRRLWAVAIPVSITYQGDPSPGQSLSVSQALSKVGVAGRGSGA